MSDISLKEKLSAQLNAVPPQSLCEGALFASEASWIEFLATSARDPEAFFFDIAKSLEWNKRPSAVGAPGDWFPGGRLNLAEICLKAGDPKSPAVLWRSDKGEIRSVSRSELGARVAEVAGRLDALGLEAGDKVGVVAGTAPVSPCRSSRVWSEAASWCPSVRTRPPPPSPLASRRRRAAR
jgi:hypothetical protein